MAQLLSHIAGVVNSSDPASGFVLFIFMFDVKWIGVYHESRSARCVQISLAGA